MSDFPSLSALGLDEILARRWSPRAYSRQAIEPARLRTLFEAARWSASCFNEQPWRFVIATQQQPDEFSRILGLLVEKNQAWAKDAWLVGFSAGKRTFTHHGSPNRFGMHDVGMATTSLMLQAAAVGLQAHAMGGFDAQRARVEFGVPEDFELGAAFTVGYPDGPVDPPATRTRRGLDELVFSGGWGESAQLR